MENGLPEIEGTFLLGVNGRLETMHHSHPIASVANEGKQRIRRNLDNRRKGEGQELLEGSIMTTLDDARLFVHRDSRVWISFYLYGMHFEEYENRQLFAPLHIVPINCVPGILDSHCLVAGLREAKSDQQHKHTSITIEDGIQGGNERIESLSLTDPLVRCVD